MRRFFRFLAATLLPVGALTLFPAIMACYLARWDRMAAITVFPFWGWCLAGASLAGISWALTHRRLSGRTVCLWLVTMLVFSDETRFLLRSGASRPEPGPPGEGRLRVINFNCRAGMFNPQVAHEVIPWVPDIVLFQETVRPPVLRDLAVRLYGGDPEKHFAGGWECGIVTRGEILTSRALSAPFSMIARIRMPGGEIVEAVSTHLRSAETDMRLYRKDAFSSHAENRRIRRADLARLLAAMDPARPPGSSLLIGGDFNAPAGDAVFRLLRNAGLTNAMEAAGSGWPDTYPNTTPMLRIDHQWVSGPLVPAGGRTAESAHSDHRMVICDYIFRR